MVNLLYFGNTPIDFFDGATNHDKCGIGVHIKVDAHHSFMAFMAIGSGTNIRAELLAFWLALHLCRNLNIMDVHLAGDSKVIIDWFNNQVALNVLLLQAWKVRIRELETFFSSLQVFHIHRIYNSPEDALSKKGLSSEVGLLHLDEYVGNERINSWVAPLL